jgi:hypothetical protein
MLFCMLSRTSPNMHTDTQQMDPSYPKQSCKAETDVYNLMTETIRAQLCRLSNSFLLWLHLEDDSHACWR